MPITPKTNGNIEKVKATIIKDTIKRNEYSDKNLMNKDLIGFLVKNNLYRLHGNLRKALNVKTPFDAIEKWYKIKPEIFIQKPFGIQTKNFRFKNQKYKQVFINNLVNLDNKLWIVYLNFQLFPSRYTLSIVG